MSTSGGAPTKSRFPRRNCRIDGPPPNLSLVGASLPATVKSKSFASPGTAATVSSTWEVEVVVGPIDDDDRTSYEYRPVRGATNATLRAVVAGALGTSDVSAVVVVEVAAVEEGASVDCVVSALRPPTPPEHAEAPTHNRVIASELARAYAPMPRAG